MSVLHRSRLGLVPCVLLALALVAPAAEVDKYLPNDTQLVISLNVRQLLDSGLVKKYTLTQIQAALKGNDKSQEIMKELGFDPLHDVSSVTIALTAVEADKMLAIIHGKFDQAKFHAKAEEVAKSQGEHLKIQKVGEYTIYQTSAPENIPGGQIQEMFVSLISADTMVASPSKDFVVEALDKGAGKKQVKLKKEVQDLIEKIDSKKTLSLFLPSSMLSSSPLASDERAKELLDKFQSIVSNVSITDEMKIDVLFNTKNADSAKELSSTIKDGLNQAKGLVAILAGDRKELAPVVDLLETFKVATDGGSVTLKGHASKDMIEKSHKAREKDKAQDGDKEKKTKEKEDK